MQTLLGLAITPWDKTPIKLHIGKKTMIPVKNQLGFLSLNANGGFPHIYLNNDNGTFFL